MDDKQFRAGSFVAQGVVSSMVPTLVVDGKWGSFSNAAYQSLTDAQKAVVDTVLRTSGLPTVAALFAHRQEVKAAAQSASKSPRGDIVTLVRAAAAELGIDVALMMATVDTESGFNPAAVNGSSRGLGQMQPAAWKDAQRVLPDLPDYKDGWKNARENARATAAYFKVNLLALARRLSAKGIRVEPWMQYLAHQQGAAGFAQLLELAQDKRPALDAKQRERMEKNPPQDGQPATTDPAEFIARWKAVTERKLARYS